MTDIIFKDESYRIIGSCMKVHSELGHGFLESAVVEEIAEVFGLSGAASDSATVAFPSSKRVVLLTKA